MKQEKIATIILGAGKGTRMKSDLPKVMMPVAGKPMIKHLLDTLSEILIDDIVVVVAPSPDGDIVAKEVFPHKTSIQDKQLGTGHAVLQAKEHLDKYDGSIVMIFGDTPLVGKQTIINAVKKRVEGNYAVVVVGISPEVSPAYGRLIINGDVLQKIVEFKDANEEERAVKLLNSGMMIFDGKILFSLLEEIGNKNAQGEYYLTDAVEIAVKKGLKCSVINADSREMFGANTREDLKLLEQYLEELKG